jgi:hypothetical protein
MTIDYVAHFQQRIASRQYRSFIEIERSRPLHHAPSGSVCQAPAGAKTQWVADVKSAARSRLAQLTDEILHRTAVYVAGGLVTGAVVLAATNVGCERHTWWGWLLIGAPLAWLSFIGMVALTFVALHAGVGALRWLLSLTERTSTHARVGLLACLAILAGAFGVLVSLSAVRHTMVMLAVFVFPCAIVLGVGGWLVVLIASHWYDAGWRWQRHAAYVLLAPVAAAAMLTLAARDTLAAQATVGLLFPIAIWLGVRTRRAVNTCLPVTVHALTDITVVLLLGLALVALVRLADALRMPSTEGVSLQEALRLAGQYANLPQWWWIGLYVLLAGASMLFARVYPQPDCPPVEATFSLLSPRRHPRIADRPASWRLAGDLIQDAGPKDRPKDQQPIGTVRIRRSSYLGATSASTPLMAPACMGRGSFRSPRMPAHSAPAKDTVLERRARFISSRLRA